MKKIAIFIAVVLALVVSKNIILNLFKKEEKIVMHGTISPYYSYTIRVYYKADSTLPFCYTLDGSAILFGGLPDRSLFVPKTTYQTYEPNIDHGQYTLTVPLGYEGLNICDYQIERIAFVTQQESQVVLFEKYVDLEYVGYVTVHSNSDRRTSRLIPLLKAHQKSDYKIDFYSDADYWEYSKEQLAKEQSPIIKDQQTIRNTRKEQKLLHKLILYPYILKYKTLPTEAEAQALLSQNNPLSYLPKDQREDTLKKLHKHITYDKDGYPVDEWGNRFVYRISPSGYATLFSFGPDGVESKDDIPPSIHQGLPDPLYDKTGRTKKKVLNTIKSINTLTSLLTRYQYKYKKIASVSEAKELFRKENRFHIYPDKNDILHFIDQEPVDEWGHPFVYDPESDRDHPVIYSLGEDGVKSGDDIRREMRRLF